MGVLGLGTGVAFLELSPNEEPVCKLEPLSKAVGPANQLTRLPLLRPSQHELMNRK